MIEKEKMVDKEEGMKWVKGVMGHKEGTTWDKGNRLQCMKRRDLYRISWEGDKE